MTIVGAPYSANSWIWLDPSESGSGEVWISGSWRGLAPYGYTVFQTIEFGKGSIRGGIVFPFSLLLSYGYARVPPTFPVVLNINKNDLFVGSINWAAGSNTPTFTFPANVFFNPGDFLTITSTISDPTFSDFSWNLEALPVSEDVSPGWPTGYTALPQPAGKSIFVNGVSGDGLVIVGAVYYDEAAQNGHACYWTQSGGLVDIGLLPGGVDGQALGANQDGSVIFGWSTDGTGLTHSFRWTKSSGGMIDLGLLSGYNQLLARAISGDGNIIVGTARGGSLFTSIKWTSGVAGFVDLGKLPGHSYSQAYGISSDGLVVAGESGTAVGANTTPYQWKAGSMTALPFIAGDTRATAGECSSNGGVIAGSTNSGIFRWTLAGGTVLIPLPVGNTGRGVSSITDDGSIIVGTVNMSTQQSVYKWTSGVGAGSSVLIPNVPSGNTSDSYNGVVSKNGKVVAVDVGSSPHNTGWVYGL
jgi:probable HAF family extracellular repeat protein